MSQSKNQNSSQPSNKDLPIHIIEKVVETQKEQIILQSQELKLREKEIEINAKLAEKQMNIQAEILKNKPAESRKSFQTVATFITIVFILFILFFMFCVYTGREDFALKIFGYFMYLVTSVVGYLIGRKSVQYKPDNKGDDVEDATVVN